MFLGQYIIILKSIHLKEPYLQKYFTQVQLLE